MQEHNMGSIKDITEKAVLDLMFKDGFGEEALDHVDEYAREIVGHKPTSTAKMLVTRRIMAILRQKRA